MHLSTKNYTNKAIAMVLFLASGEMLFAQNINNVQYNQDITFDAHISTGTQSMKANEYVYHPYTGDKLSQLIWNTDSLFMVGLGGSLHFQKKYTLNIDYWFSVNKSDSKMTDYDWIIANYVWTHRSIHKNTDVSNASSFDISAEYSAFQYSTTTISPLLGYRQDSATRKAYGGTYVYSEENFRDSSGTIPNNILGITYKQTWKSPYLGLKTNTHISNLLTFHTKIIYAPVVKGKATDMHHLRDKFTTDSLDNTHMYSLDFGLGYKLSPMLTLDLNYMYQKYNTTKGDSQINIEERSIQFNNIAGADLKTSLLSISLEYKF